MPNPRKVHITPSQRKYIVESVNAKYEALDKLPLHISDDVDNKETPLSDNPFLPFEDRTLRKLLIERFTYLSDALGIKDVKTLQKKTSKLFSVLRKREENIISQLETLCYNFVQEIFGNSEDDFDYDGHIVNNVKDKAFVVTPKTGSEPIPQDNAVNVEKFDRLLKKRMFVNALVVGFANFSTYYMLKEHKAEIDKYGDGLADMYREAMLLNEYDAFLSDPEITDEDNKQGGYGETVLSTEENSSKITCRAVLFPILLYESIKAVMDIFASFSLPEDKKLAKVIMDKADTLVNDVWYFRVGTQLWKKFIAGVDFDSHAVPYFMKRLLSLKDSEISEVVHEVLLGTERGHKIITNMFKASARDVEYGDFEQDITNRQYQQSLIVDSQDDEQFFLNENRKKTVILSEVQKKYILAESQESKSISAAKKLLVDKLGYDEQQADEFVRIKLRNDLPVLRTPQGGKFILGVTRMFLDDQLRSANDISNLNSTLKYVASDAHIGEYDRNLNGLSCSELIERFSQARTANLEAEKEEVNAMVFDEDSQYDIVRIDSFKQARKYGKYTSWCVTHDKGMFNSYTSDEINQFYFCLRHGFENIEKVAGEDCPLDDYGLSMIAVCVNEDGALNTCTCRWNHDNGGNDSIMSAVEISRVVGVNFFNTFKPNGKWEEILNTALSRLQNGEAPKNVFDVVRKFVEGFANVRLNGKGNFLTREGRLLSQKWFDEVYDFSKGFARVKLNDKGWNFLTRGGKYLSQQWFDWVYDFYESFARVALNKKYNFLTRGGKYLSQRWFDWAGDFSEGFAWVVLNDKENFINRNGEFLSQKWFDKVSNFHEGFAWVALNKKYNFLNSKGKVVSGQWFDSVGDFSEGLAWVVLNGSVKYLDRNGKLWDEKPTIREGMKKNLINY